MHCGSLSQGFAECLQKETKQVTDAEKAAPGYLSHQVPANATETQGERLKSHPTQTEPERGAASAVGRPSTGRSRSEGGHSEPHRLRKTVPHDHRSSGQRW